MKRVVKNSFFQTIGAFGITGLNFILLLGYARILGPEKFGSLVTSQAQVLVWAIVVDLGLSNALIGALTAAEKDRSDLSRQGFRGRDLILRVLFVRFLGASIGAVGVSLFAWLNHHGGDSTLLWQDIAFAPHLFALGLQQTALAYAAYRHYQGFSVVANLAGVALTVILPLFLALRGAAIPWLLLAQSWGGLFTGIVIFLFFIFQQRNRKKKGHTRRLERQKKGPWAREAWRALASDAGPYAITYAVFVLYSRLDQIVASRLLGFESGGNYALAVRLVAIPILVSTSISFAIFPDMQRIGRDAPERLATMLGAFLKLIYRYGIFLAAIFLLGLGFVMAPLFPKFEPAIKILPFFVPGVWGYWAQAFIVNALFGARAYGAVIRVHLFSLGVYLLVLFVSPRFMGLYGVVLAFNAFCLSMFLFGYRTLISQEILQKKFALGAPFAQEEKKLLAQLGDRFRWLKRGAQSQ